MKKYLLAFALLLTAFLPGRAAQTRYVSAWTAIPANSQVTFTHGLLTRPLLVQVWGAFPVTSSGGECQADFQVVYPASESEALELYAVSPSLIMVSNHGDVGICAQVVGEQ